MYLDRWRYAIPLRLRRLVRPDVARQELDDELRFHAERLAESYVAQGMLPQDAAITARRVVEAAHEESPAREPRGSGNGLLERWLRDARFALRGLRRSPGYAFV